MPRSRAKSTNRSRSRSRSRSRCKMNCSTRRGTRTRKQTVSFINEQKNLANKAEAKKVERETAKFYKRYKNIGIEKNEVNARHTRSNRIKNLHAQTKNQKKGLLDNLIGSLEKFKFSNSPKSRKSPKNPFMVNRTKPLNMTSLLKEIQNMK